MAHHLCINLKREDMFSRCKAGFHWFDNPCGYSRYISLATAWSFNNTIDDTTQLSIKLGLMLDRLTWLHAWNTSISQSTKTELDETQALTLIRRRKMESQTRNTPLPIWEWTLFVYNVYIFWLVPRLYFSKYLTPPIPFPSFHHIPLSPFSGMGGTDAGNYWMDRLVR